MEQPGEQPVGFVGLLGDAARDDLLRLGRGRRYRPGAVLFAEGDRTDSVVLLRRGRVKVFCSTSEGREPVLAMRGAGELVGELAAIDAGEQPRVATVVATEPVLANEIPAAEFRDFVGSHPEAAMALLQMLTARLRGADRRRVEFGGYDTQRRLTRLLVELAEEHGVPDAGGVRIEVPLTQDELAGMIGASRESVARALVRLRSTGLVRTARRTITVIDIERMHRHCAS